MLALKVLIREGFCAVNASTTGAIAVEEVSALDHETFDLQNFRFDLLKTSTTNETRSYILRDETCCLCSLGDFLEDSSSLQCNTDESFQLF